MAAEDLGKAALTELFESVRNEDTPIIVERVVTDIDGIVRYVRFAGWQPAERRRRARCVAYLVARPRLLEVNCRTIPRMRLANALCRFVELAKLIATANATPSRESARR
jgi:hypothetical protein